MIKEMNKNGDIIEYTKKDQTSIENAKSRYVMLIKMRINQ